MNKIYVGDPRGVFEIREIKESSNLDEIERAEAFNEIVKILRGSIPKNYKVAGITIDLQDRFNKHMQDNREEVIIWLKKNRMKLVKKLKLL